MHSMEYVDCGSKPTESFSAEAGGAKRPAGIRAAFARAAPPRRTARVIEEDDEG